MSLLHADVVVVGTELCGLAAAALLAHARHKVIVIDDDETHDIAALGDVMLPTAPCLWRLPKEGPAVEIIDALGLRQDAKRLLQEPVGVTLVDDPDVRMTLFVDEAARNVELKRVFGDDKAAATQQALEALSYDVTVRYLSEATRLHEDGFFARRKEKKRVESLLEAGHDDPADVEVQTFRKKLDDTGLAAAISHLGPFLQHLDDKQTGGVADLLALARLHRGTLGDCAAGLGPRHALRTMFIRVIEGHGGEVHKGTVSGVSASGKKLSQVDAKLASGAKQYAAKAVIDATCTRSLVDRIAGGRVTDKERKRQQVVQARDAAVVVRWVLPTSMLPEGAGERMVLLPSVDGEAAVLVAVLRTPQTAAAFQKGKDDRADDVVGIVASARGASAADVERRLEQLFPFAKPIARDAVEHADAQSIAPVYAQHDDGPAHVLGGIRPRSSFANMARAGRDLVPLFGLGGELSAARSVSSLVDEWLQSGKR